MTSEPTRAEQTRAALARLFTEHERAVLAFSGGRDSLVMRHLCEPWRDRITLVWTNTGEMWPHMVAFVRDAAEGWNFAELSSDVLANWREHGMPADVVPVRHATRLGLVPREPRIQPWTACCMVVRGHPVAAYVAARNDVTLFLRGQKREDGLDLSQAALPGASAVHADPLWEWSSGDVQAYVDAHGITLPFQYAEGVVDSLECWICTADRNRPVLDLMRRLMPERHALVVQGMRTVRDTARAALAEVDAVLADEAEPKLERVA